MTTHNLSVNEPSMGSWAVKYASFGWFVFPCSPKDKTPLTPNGFKDATTDPLVIGEWWSKTPDAAIGIDCGRSGIAVVDHDPAHDETGEGLASITALLDGVETREASTTSGGVHYYFGLNGHDIRNSASKLGPGVDVRAKGGYVIAAPSRAQNRAGEIGQYAWRNQNKIAELPESVARALQDTKPKDLKSIPAGEEGKVGIGQRHDRLVRLAGKMRYAAMSPHAIELALLKENEDNNAPPLARDEVLTIARSAQNWSVGQRLGPTPGEDVSEPETELLTMDSVRVTLPTEDRMGVTFTFSEMEKDRRELAAYLSLSLFGHKQPYQQRVNLLSVSQRTELRRELDGLYGKDHAWAKVLNTVWSMAAELFLSQDRSLGVEEIPHLVGQRDLISPLMPSEGTTIFFGDGSSAKSYIALHLAVAGVTQTLASGQFSVPEGNVMFVDYEDSDTNFRRRVGRILAGLDLTMDSVEGRLRYWRARGVPLKDTWEAIRSSCDRNSVTWIIVDSAGPACGGPPEDAQSAISYFQAVERIGRPCVTIAHISKDQKRDTTQKPFGSTFWHNGARRTWFVRRSQEEASDVAEVALMCRKVNDGPKPRPLGITVEFEGDEGPVRFSGCDVNRNPDLVQSTTAQNQIWLALTDRMTTREIALATGLNEGTVAHALRKHRDRFVEIGSLPKPGGGRPEKVWSRLQREEDIAL